MFWFLSNIWTWIKNVTSNIFNRVSWWFKYVFSWFFSTLWSLVFKGKQELSTTNIDYKQQDIIDDQNKEIEALNEKKREERRLEQLKSFNKQPWDNDLNNTEINVDNNQDNKEWNDQQINDDNIQSENNLDNTENNVANDDSIFNNDVVDTNLDNYQINITSLEVSIVHIVTKKIIYVKKWVFTNIKWIESIVNNYNPRNIFWDDWKIKKEFVDYLSEELSK